MREEAVFTTTIAAPPTTCFEVAADIEQYPLWAADIKDAEIVERDDEGRPSLVTFRAAAMGRSTTYTLRYDYAHAPVRLAWVQDDGDVTRVLDGSWEFFPVDDDQNQTEVRYSLTVELAMPLPGFVKRRAEGRIVHTAIDDFTERAETLASS
ncbi:MAG: SRPBCC family protein [Actinomycetota bacterium]